MLKKNLHRGTNIYKSFLKKNFYSLVFSKKKILRILINFFKKKSKKTPGHIFFYNVSGSEKIRIFLLNFKIALLQKRMEQGNFF